VKRVLLAMSITWGAVCGGCEPLPSASPPQFTPAGDPRDVLLITVDTLRSDHLGAYGYARETSPNIDALAARGTLFESAYTYWPKTRASFVMMLTGRTPAANGFSNEHPQLLDFNPTLAQSLKDAGYITAAAVDNPNVASDLGYAKGFDEYIETWEDASLASEMERTAAITAFAQERLSQARSQPLFLWLHYVNPHTPYEPPTPYDTQFVVDDPSEPDLPVVEGMRGGIPQQWVLGEERRLGYYISQYDGEIATVDREIGRVLAALAASSEAENTVIVLTSDHGESLGEHDYYFDHGADVFEPSLAVPMIVVLPEATGPSRSAQPVSTLDVLPTILDAVKVSFPAELGGSSMLPYLAGTQLRARRLFAQNDLHFRATWDDRFKLVVEPDGEKRERHSLYDRRADPAEEHNLRRESADAYREQRTALEAFFEAEHTRRLSLEERLAGGGRGASPRLSDDACRRLAALGYVTGNCE